MRSTLMLVGLVSLSVTMPALAKSGGNDEAHAKHAKATGMQKSEKHAKHMRGDADRYEFTGNERGVGRTFDPNRSLARDGRSCPPGLAKKNNGCLPPGQAAKRFGVGERLPSSYSSYNVPAQYRDQYRDTDQDLYRYNSDGSLYRVDAKTRVVEEVIKLLGR